MVIIISYNKQKWNEYDDNQTADKNLANGAIISADRLNHMETGISNNDTNKVTDNKNGSIKVNGSSITPADDSKVVHDNHDNTITANKLIYDLSKTGLTPLTIINSGSFNNLPLGTVMANATAMTDGPDRVHAFTTTTFYFSDWNGRKAQIAIADTTNLMYFRVAVPTWSSWTLLSDDSKVVHTADMRKPASDVAGIEEVNVKQDKIAYTPADDSKVLHPALIQLNSTDMDTVLTAGFYHLISGTNGMPNADYWTIYQVIPWGSTNGVQIAFQTNKTILGMRSWYNINQFTSWVQFADDSKVAHLSGANNFDTVPTVDNNPLLLASSLPSDLARTGQANTFTAAQTFSIAPTITDASKDKGDTQAATMADLKSVEKSAWRQLNVFSNIFDNYEGIYKINSDEKYLEISACGTTNKNGTILFDLSSIINKIVSIDMEILTENRPIGGVHFRGAILTGDKSYGRSCLNSYEVNGFARVYYNNLQPGVI